MADPDPAEQTEQTEQDPRNNGGGAMITVGFAMLGLVYGWVGAAVLWYRGAGLVRALAIAGVWSALTIIGVLVFIGRRSGRGSGAPARGTAVRAAGLVHLSLLVAVVAVVVAWPLIRTADWGTAGERVPSPGRDYVAVTYDWSAMIDPGWNIAVERIDGSDRQWFWRGTEHPVPAEVRFAGENRIEVVDDVGVVWVVDIDPETLEPSDRYCTNTSYCHQWPWDQYTKSSPAE